MCYLSAKLQLSRHLRSSKLWHGWCFYFFFYFSCSIQPDIAFHTAVATCSPQAAGKTMYIKMKEKLPEPTVITERRPPYRQVGVLPLFSILDVSRGRNMKKERLGTSRVEREVWRYRKHLRTMNTYSNQG